MTRFNERFQSDASESGGGGGGATSFDTIYDLYDAIDNESFTGEWKISWTGNDYLDEGAIRGGVVDGEPFPHPFTQCEIPVNICGDIWDTSLADGSFSYTDDGYPKLDPSNDAVTRTAFCEERYGTPIAPLGFVLRFAMAYGGTADNGGTESVEAKNFGAGVGSSFPTMDKGLHLGVRWYSPGTDWVWWLTGNGASTNSFANVSNIGGIGDQIFKFTATVQRTEWFYAATDYTGPIYHWHYSTERTESYPAGRYSYGTTSTANGTFSWRRDLPGARPYFFCLRGTGYTGEEEISTTLLTLFMPTLPHSSDGTM